MDAVLEQPLVDYLNHCAGDADETSMDALPNLWENNSFDSSIAVELEDDDYQSPIWPTGPLDFEEENRVNQDDEDDLLLCGGGHSESAMVVLHGEDRPAGIKDRSGSNRMESGSSPIIFLTNASGSRNVSAKIPASHAPTYSITFDSQGEVEITENAKSSTEMADPLADIIKDEPLSPKPSGDHPASGRESRKRTLPMPHPTIKMKPSTNGRLIVSNSSSPRTIINTNSSNVTSNAPARPGSFMLPPTPPSSSSSSDSEGSSSPVRDEAAGSPNSETGSETESAISPLTSPSRRSNCQQQPAGRVLLTNSPTSNGTSKASTSDPLASAGTTTSIRHPIHSPLISYQPKGSTGTLQLTEEEKRTLLSEGYPVPTRLPLTKAEEKSLKKIRRKIKNKISAQESRRKKKEYMDTLERRAQILADENSDYQLRLRQLEMDNQVLQSQLNRLQQILMDQQKQQQQAIIKTENESPSFSSPAEDLDSLLSTNCT